MCKTKGHFRIHRFTILVGDQVTRSAGMVAFFIRSNERNKGCRVLFQDRSMMTSSITFVDNMSASRVVIKVDGLAYDIIKDAFDANAI